MREDLRAYVGDAADQVRVHVPRQQRYLEEQDASRPGRRRPSQVWKDHLARHRLTDEEQKCAQEERSRENGDSNSSDHFEI